MGRGADAPGDPDWHNMKFSTRQDTDLPAESLFAAISNFDAIARLLTRRDLGPVQLLGLRLADGSSIRIRQAGPVAAEIGQEVPLALDLRQLYLFPDQPEPAAVA